jgi:hypothetical protein
MHILRRQRRLHPLAQDGFQIRAGSRTLDDPGTLADQGSKRRRLGHWKDSATTTLRIPK